MMEENPLPPDVSMSHLKAFFSQLTAELNTPDGFTQVMQLAQEPSYAGVTELLRRAMLIPQDNAQLTGLVLSEKERGLVISQLKELVTKDENAIQGLQDCGLTFLECLKTTSFFDRVLDLTPTTIFSKFSDTDPAFKTYFLRHYDARKGLEALSATGFRQGRSHNDLAYHTDLIVKIMDAVQTPDGENVILNYLSKLTDNPNQTPLVWGLYLHPNTTSAIRAWQETHQKILHGFTDTHLITAELKACYDRPFKTLTHLVQAGHSLNPGVVVDLVATMHEVPQEDYPKLGWVLSSSQQALTQFFSSLDQRQQQIMLEFGAKNSLPVPGSYVPGTSEINEAVFLSAFLHLAQTQPSPGLWRHLIDAEMARKFTNDRSLFLAFAIEQEPEYFSSICQSSDTSEVMSLLQKTVKPMMEIFENTESDVETIDHCDSRIGLKRTSADHRFSITRLDGVAYPLANFHSLLKDFVAAHIEKVITRDHSTSGRKQKLKNAYKEVDGLVAGYALMHDLLSLEHTQALLGIKNFRERLGQFEFPQGVIEKMSSTQKTWLLERDLNL
jgi:hypothetical protein